MFKPSVHLTPLQKEIVHLSSCVSVKQDRAGKAHGKTPRTRHSTCRLFSLGQFSQNFRKIETFFEKIFLSLLSCKFSERSKKVDFSGFRDRFRENRLFFEKKNFFTFLTLKSTNFVQVFRKIREGQFFGISGPISGKQTFF